MAGILQVCRVQLPGREERVREPAFTNVLRLAKVLADVLQPWFDRPFALFGHSMGALISFELTRELRRRSSVLPRHLFVSGRAAPHLPSRTPSIHHLCDVEFRRELRLLNGTPEQVLQDDELMKFLLPSLRADFSVCETYEHAYEEPLSLPITAFGGESDPRASAEEIRAWSEHTRARAGIRMFPGDHFYLQSMRPAVTSAILAELCPLLNPGTGIEGKDAFAGSRAG
jgi:surfactin synthase thioesterase subunit